MAATIEIHEMSALATGVDKTSSTVRFKAADNATVDTNDPIQVPAAGSTYSYSKTLRAYMEAPPDTNVSNIRAYTDGTNNFGAGVTLTARNLGVSWAANVNTEVIDTVNPFSYDAEDNAIDLSVTDTGPWVPADDDTYIGDLLRLQMVVASTASHGATPTESLTFAWDEI